MKISRVESNIDRYGVPRNLKEIIIGTNLKEIMKETGTDAKANVFNWIRKQKNWEKTTKQFRFIENKYYLSGPAVIYDSEGLRYKDVSLARLVAAFWACSFATWNWGFKWCSLDAVLSIYENNDFRKLRELEEDLDQFGVCFFDSLNGQELSPKRKQALSDLVQRRLIQERRKDVIIVQTPIAKIHNYKISGLIDALEVCHRLVITSVGDD